MNVEYCTKCGYKNTYSVQAPNFCGGCGSPMREVPASNTPSLNTSRRVVEQTEDLEDSVPNISKLEYEVHDQGQKQRLSIADLMKQGPTEGGKIKRGRGSKKLSNRQEILEEGLRSCKSAKTQPPEDVEG